MNMQRHTIKIMFSLWTLTCYTVCLVGLQLTAANVIATETATRVTATASPTFQSTSIETDLNVLRVETTTASTIHLRLNDNIERINGGLQQQEEQKQQLDKTTMTSTTTTLQSQQPLTSKAFASSSITTLASINAPATITNQAKEEMLTMPGQQKQQTEDNNVALTTATTVASVLMKQFKNNDDELEEMEIEKTDIKQVTESVVATENEKQEQQKLQQQQREITTDVNWQKETDTKTEIMPGNARIKENVDIKMLTTTSTPTAKSLTTATQKDAIENRKENIVTFTTTPSLDSEQHRDIAGDDAKPLEVFIPATLPIENTDHEALTQTPLPDNRAIEEFKPIIRDANMKLLREHTVFSTQADINKEEWKQNLMPNELEYKDHKILKSKPYQHNINWSPYLHLATPVTDFTGKLLQEQDGVITEIEQKFKLDEFVDESETKTTTENPKPALSYSVNHEILLNKKSPVLQRPPAVEFIERRVKKSFDFPMHRMASDAQHMQQHFDFANTKFSSNNNQPINTQAAEANAEGSASLDKSQPQARPQPEFSTTKFYNSKELYNEMLQHKAKQQQQKQPQLPQLSKLTEKDLQELNNRQPSLALNSFAVLHSPKIAKLEELHEAKETQQPQKTLAIKKVTVKSTKLKAFTTTTTTDKTNSLTTTTREATQTNSPSTSTLTPVKSFSIQVTTTTDMPAVEGAIKVKKFQKELNRAKLLIKSMMPLQSTNTTVKAITIDNNSNNNNSFNEKSILNANKEVATASLWPTQQNTQTEAAAVAALLPSTSVSRPTSYFYAASSYSPSPLTSTNAPKTSLHPIVRPRILSRLQEKINSLECELQNLPQDSHLWRGNETHELLLPIMTPENCKTDKDCTAMMVSWEGEAEIQSGDILIVEINDALLVPKDINLTTSAHNTQVYQVTRSGHEHCDVTEGILLDITPLIVDGRKLVTLYDKDLTEGVNLLIVVSELWGSQCVRLKVTTKTENCGENADCSGKGICFSNYDMEEYECQCCSGFAGPHCEEIDACTPSPCTNNGICVDLSQGHEGNSYQCLCPYGYTGKNCQYELDPCNPAECMNGGSCVGNSTHFRCECSSGYTGPLCQHSLNECESSPCIHGICVDQEDGFRCFCQPGFAGELCNFEYNECESNPCQNGGECIDHIGSFECRCTKGYTGNRCQIKVDFCSNKPCPEGRRCIDHGNDYSCECLGGRNGPDCNEMQRTQCNVNPCTHGGTCWSSGDSFYCACRPGYTGTMCEDEFVVETVVSSSEFMVDDTSARNFNDKSFGSSVVLKSPIELHNAYTAAIVLALVIFFVALYLTICHCKVNQTYRKFSTRTYGFLPILGFRLRTKQATSKISRHWLSGKGLGIGNVMRGSTTTSSTTTSASALHRNGNAGHLPTAKASSSATQHHQTNVGQLNERPFQRHLAMNLENDMYYTVDFSENSQHSPLIQ